MKKAKQFTIRVADQPGTLAEVASALWREGVNIQALLADVHGDKNVVHLVVDKPASARKIFAVNGWKAREDEVAVLTLPDKPGSLAAVAARLGNAGINIQHAFTGSTKGAGKASIYLAVSDLPKTVRTLRRAAR